MRFLAPAALLAASAAPALAHSGRHLHPHAAGDWLTAVAVLALIAFVAALVIRR